MTVSYIVTLRYVVMTLRHVVISKLINSSTNKRRNMEFIFWVNCPFNLSSYYLNRCVHLQQHLNRCVLLSGGGVSLSLTVCADHRVEDEVKQADQSAVIHVTLIRRSELGFNHS